MRCSCLDDLKEKIKNEIPTQSRYSKLKITRVVFDNENFLFTDAGVEKNISLPITIDHEPVSRKKQTKINISVSFCPFCGISVSERKEETA